MKAVLPVAGNGTRMYPLGVDTPKALITILNKPLVLWSIDALRANGIDEVILVTSAGKFGTMIKEYAETLSFPDLKIRIAIQEQQLGTAHVLQMAKKYFVPGEEFIFLYGDDLYGPENIAQLLTMEGIVVTGKKVSDPEKWGILQTNENGKLLQVVEKPKEFVGDLASIGCMKLTSEVFDLYDKLQISPRGEYELTDTLQLLADERKVTVIPTKDYWIPIGYPWHVLDAAEYFLPQIDSDVQGTVEENVTIKGKLRLPASSRILSGSYIDGNVVIGENVVVGPNACIRKNAVIGDNTRVGFSVQIKNAVIGRNCKVDHLAYIGDSVIGNNVYFPAMCCATNLRHDEQQVTTPIKGTIVSTGRRKFGTVIGNNVRLGAGTIIYPGRKIWPDKTTKPGEVVEKDIVS